MNKLIIVLVVAVLMSGCVSVKDFDNYKKYLAVKTAEQDSKISTVEQLALAHNGWIKNADGSYQMLQVSIAATNVNLNNVNDKVDQVQSKVDKVQHNVDQVIRKVDKVKGEITEFQDSVGEYTFTFLFGRGDYTLSEKQKKSAVAEFNHCKGGVVQFIGRASGDGSEAKNLELASKRANVIRELAVANMANISSAKDSTSIDKFGPGNTDYNRSATVICLTEPKYIPKDGKDGAVGPQGPEGPMGPQGPAGKDGLNNAATK